VAYGISEIEGIGPVQTGRLSRFDITTTDDLLERCADRSGRRKLAEISGISEKLLLKWANMADLMRISGIGPEYSELLEAGGVDTVKVLRNRRASNLARKLAQVNVRKKLTRRVPSEATVERWVGAAKRLRPLITH